MKKFLPLLILLSLPTLGLTRDLHVDPASGDDKHDGISKPLKTIPRAIRLSGPGDTIHLKPVVYRDYAGFYDKKGEPGKPITLDGHGAILEGSDPVRPHQWEEISSGLFKSDQFFPKLNDAIIGRWFFLINGKMVLMNRTSKGKSAPLKKTNELKPGEWTFEKGAILEEGKGGSYKGTFYIRLKSGKTLEQAQVRTPARSAGVQFSGDNAHLVIRNLTASHAYNDGFNIHGDCRDVKFENIRAIECGDDGISAHETAEYSVDGFVSIGNSTGICDTGGSTTSYNRVFIADCVGVDLYFLDTGKYSISNSVVLSSAQKPLLTIGNKDGQCRMKIDNLYIQRLTTPQPVLIAGRSIVTASRLTLKNLDVKVTGEAYFKSCMINGKPHPENSKSPGANLKHLLETVVPDSYKAKINQP